MGRVVCWFSCGAASATATALAIDQVADKYPEHELVIVSIFLKNEHKDSHRFLKDCEKWFGQEILVIKNEKYNADVDIVIEKSRYMAGVYGAKCTKELKKQVRYDWQRPDDVHVFGFTANESHRINGLIDNENELMLWNPLIDEGYTKERCFSVIGGAGIEIPEMYKLGFNNNNCIGCLKAQGAGYWNLTRKEFPEVFERRAKQEELLNVSLTRVSYTNFLRVCPDVVAKIKQEESNKGIEILKVSDKNQCRMPLRYLPDYYGCQKSIYVEDCGFFCEQGDFFYG